MMRLFIFAFFAAISISPGLKAQPVPPSQSVFCPHDRLVGQLGASETWYEMMRHKRESGYLPAQGEIERRVMLDLSQLRFALLDQSDSAPAYALVYGKGDRGRRCLWLVDFDGVVASDVLPDEQPAAAVHQIWAGLQVHARTRASRSARSADGACPPYVPQEYAPAPQAVVEDAEAAMEQAAQRLIPGNVGRAIAELDSFDSRLLILPTGNLRKVPFAALPVGNGFLLDHFVPVIVPSIAALTDRERDEVPDGGEKLVVGNPDLADDDGSCWVPLPEAEREAQYIANAAGEATLLTGRAASHDAVFDRLIAPRPLDLIYLATHGVTDPINPADASFLALAEGHLVGAQLRELQLQGDPLVVMSACQTGLGKEFEEGVFGLPEAWHYAGASRIVMSLWNVSDWGTAELMEHFIDRLAYREWQDADRALAEAMREMRRRDPDPMIWAAFAFYGVPGG